MIISKTPLRCSFFGGGTDFKDYYENTSIGYGKTLSTALNMHVYITVNQSFDKRIRLCYAGNELVDTVDEVKHNIIREALKMMGIENNIEIIYSADIPLSSAGVGLASSSALAVGVLNALHAFLGQYVTPTQLAKEACEIELNKLGQHIGIQDQYAVAFGGFHTYTFNPGDSVAVNPVICKHETKNRLQDNLLLYFTGKTRDSRKILSEQEHTIADKMSMLDSLVNMAETAYDDLAVGNVDDWGRLLAESWEIKKHFAHGVSNDMIDKMYSLARKAGATGGKVLGAGGGGFLLVYAPEGTHDAVREAMSDYREVPFGFDPQGTQIIFSD